MSLNKQLPLYSKHLQFGAKMVDFHGWKMPLQYESIITEHKHTREKASVFDVSHMGEFIVKGKRATDFLNFMQPRDIQKANNNQAIYTCLLNKNGGVIDDLIIYKINDKEYMLCVNASNEIKDFDWLEQHSKTFDVELKKISSHIVLLAYQGREAVKVLTPVLGEQIKDIDYYYFKEIHFQGKRCFVARMGYTGEDGFEVFLPKEVAETFWENVFEKDTEKVLKPAGLGARDTLRLEMCFPLHGNDLNEKKTALESKLSWILDFEKKDFIGKDALKKKESPTKLIAFSIKEKGGIPRKGYPIVDDNNRLLGEVTSGGLSPILNYGIGMGYVLTEKSKVGNKVFITIRNKAFQAEIVKPPFYKMNR